MLKDVGMVVPKIKQTRLKQPRDVHNEQLILPFSVTVDYHMTIHNLHNTLEFRVHATTKMNYNSYMQTRDNYNCMQQ